MFEARPLERRHLIEAGGDQQRATDAPIAERKCQFRDEA